MTKFLAILKKELKHHIYSPSFYIFVVSFLVLAFFLFFRSFYLVNQVTLRGFFDFLPWILLFFLPAISMRIWSEEYKQGTIENLLTSSVSLFSLVISKYFSLLIFLLLVMISTLVLPISVSFLGDLDWGVVFSSYIAMFFLGAVFLAVGQTISALTNNQIIAFIITLLICFFWYMLGTPLVIYSLPNSLANIFSFLGLGSYYSNITRGVLLLSDIVFFLSVITIFIYFNVQILKKQQGVFFRSLKNLSLVLVFIFVNILTSSFYLPIDFTANKFYTLTETTKDTISNLNQELEVKVFVSEEVPPLVLSKKQQFLDVLTPYQKIAGSKLKFDFIDPKKSPKDKPLAQFLGIREIPVEIRNKDKVEVSNVYLGLAILDPKEEKNPNQKGGPLDDYLHYEAIPFVQDISNFEYEFVSYLKKINQENKTKIGFLTGHKEDTFRAKQINPFFQAQPKENEVLSFKEDLEKLYQVEDIDLKISEKENKDVLEKLKEKLNDIKTLVLTNPKEKFNEKEISLLHNYVKAGGNLVMLLDTVKLTDQMSLKRYDFSFDELLKPWGIKLKSVILKDDLNEQVAFNQGFMQFYKNYPFFVKVMNFADSLLLNGIKQIVLPWVSSLEIEKKEKIDYQEILFSSNTYQEEALQELREVPVEKNEDKNKETDKKEEEVETVKQLVDKNIDLSPTQNFNFKKQDKKAVLGVFAQKENEGKVLVVSDSDFIKHDITTENRQNLLFFFNVIDYFSGNQKMISLRNKEIMDYPISQDINDTTKDLIKWLNIILMPSLVVLCGVILRLSRNAKKK
jgi:ABC-2 type transport system permease protein